MRRSTAIRLSLRWMALAVGILTLVIISITQQSCFEVPIEPGIEGVMVTFSTDKMTYEVGEAIRMTLTVQNSGDESATLTFNDGQTYDFIVREMPMGNEVWRWSHDKAFTEAIWSMTLMPGDKKSYSEVWNQKNNASLQVKPGIYQIEANLSCEPEMFADPLEIRIAEKSDVEQEFETIDKGFHSGYTTRCSFVIRDEAKWAEVWGTHTSIMLPPIPPPQIDFSSYMVIAVFRGEFTSSGFSTEITRVVKSIDKIVVTVVEEDDPNGMLLDVITHPYHIVKLRRSNLSVEFVYHKHIK